jgi:hypothetical protein
VSDERIFAEVVRADQIKVGDRVAWFDKVVTVKTIERHGDRIELIYEERACVPALKSEFVVRILPPPVEVRDLWRAKITLPDGREMQEDFVDQEDAISYGRWEKGQLPNAKIEIIPLRAVFLRREEGEA